jgi:membrane-bound lytic murein transglycosylase D
LRPSIKNTLLIITGFGLGICVISALALTLPKNDQVLNETTNQLAIVDSITFIHSISFTMPDNANFSGEIIPLQNIEVWESLDREITTNVFWQSNMQFYIKRANRWFPIIEPILKAHNIPDDFKYLAVIESGLLNVTSPSGAKGFWQFMKTTAGDYGLEVNEHVDERNHLEKSTHAACKYLHSAYKQFGNWTLAAASYNMGKAGLLAKLKEQQVNNYYDLLLNVETARYVYRIIAVKYIMSNPEKYGFNIHPEHLYPTYSCYSIDVTTSIDHLIDFAITHNTNYKTLKLLNPWLMDKSLPNKHNKTYQLLLPISGKGLDMVSSPDNAFGNGN